MDTFRVVGRTLSEVQSDDEREAVEWLKEIAPHVKCMSDPLGQRGEQHAHTIKVLLAQARMPEVIPSKVRDAMQSAWMKAPDSIMSDHLWQRLYGAIREQLMPEQLMPKPKTIEVEVWSVEFAVKESGRWVPAHSSVLYEKKSDAEEIAANKRRHTNCRFVAVTGPFMRTVPAD